MLTILTLIYLPHIGSLFIYNRFQSLSLGSLAFNSLETLALTRYSAKTLTLDTMPNEMSLGEVDKATGKTINKRPVHGTEQKAFRWYLRKGYRENRVSPRVI